MKIVKSAVNKWVVMLFFINSIIIYSQTDTLQNKVNLKQKLINANYQNINNRNFSSKNSTTPINIVNYSDYYYDELNSLTASPSSSEIFRISQFESELYTGAQDIKIPLFTITEGDISVPIVLQYHTSGIKVDQKASEVGLGWSLLKGPQITRKINVTNDWFETNPSTPVASDDKLPKPIGYFKKVRDNLPLAIPTNVAYSVIHNLADTMPDEYFVNLKGKMKKFIFLDENTASELTKSGLKISATSYNFPNLSTFQPKDFKQFNITDNDGLKYSFEESGFKTSSGESMEVTSYSSTFFGEPIAVSEWSVSKIEDMFNNTEVNFEYITNNNYEVFNSTSENSHTNCSFFYGNHANFTANCEQCITPPVESSMLANPIFPREGFFNYFFNYNTTVISSKKYISKISFDTGSIVFSYDTNSQDYILKSIEQFDKQNHSIKKYVLNYNYFGCTSNNDDVDQCKQRLKLVSLNDSSTGTYEFSYNSLPLYSYTTTKHDFLGYHTNTEINDNSIGLYYYPNEKEWSLLPFNLPIPQMTPDGQFERQKIKLFNNEQATQYKLKILPPSDYAKAGVLEKIKFPTGGEQYFEYELNDFLLFDKYQVQGGGIRIKKTYLKDQNTIQNKIDYEYKTATNKSSGLLLSPPYMGYPLIPFDMGNGFTEIMNENDASIFIYFSLYNKTNSDSDIINGSVIGYGRVVKRYDDNSYEEFVLRNDNGNYDVISQHFTSDTSLPSSPDNFNNYTYGIFKMNNSADLIKYKNFDSYGNGNLLEKSIYNNVGNLIRKTTNNYRNNQFLTLNAAFPYRTMAGRPDDDYGYLKFLKSWNYGTYRKKYVSYFNDIINTSTIDYLPSGTKLISENFTYIDNFSNKIRKISMNNGLEKEIEYLFDYSYSMGSPEYNLIFLYNDLFAKKSEKTTLNSKFLSKNIIKYNNYNIGTETLPKIAEIAHESINGSVFSDSKIISYNNKGKIKENISNNISTTTIWGYNDSLPIAKIVGATYSQVESFVSEIILASNKDATPEIYNMTSQESENQLINKLIQFQNNPLFKDFQITTFTYDPLIGVTSKTPPSGIREIYRYDSQTHQLQRILDINGNILKEFKYNYKH
ncbi:hypothetical protein ACLB9Y_00860 [Chryseobacterium scophthalmum]|uniref:hypothetical protein n=1 Tax=Chryseobacterium scophthalmum TaxID=59733 RepID=UPI00398A8B12